MMQFFSEKIRKIAAILAAFLLGCLVTWACFPRIRTVEVVKTERVEVPVQVAAEVRRESVVSYVPKESEPGTGQKEDTDVDIKTGTPAIRVKVNDKKYDFSPLPDEKYKFERGKLLVEQTSGVDLNLKIPVQTVDKTKRNAIGYGYNSRHEEELTLRHRFGDRWGVYVRGEGDVFKHVTGHGKGLRSCGAGVEFYF